MKNHILFFMVSLPLALTLSSCTLIGYGTGLLIEPAAAHDTVAIFTDIKSYRGQDARIIFRDSIQSATFDDYVDESAEEYRKRYEHSAVTDATILPFGNHASVVEDYAIFSKGSFCGYFPEGIILDNKKIYFGDFDGIFTQKYILKDSLKNRFAANTIPIRAKLYFTTKEKSFSITNRDFQNVYIMPHNSFPWRWIGAVIGLSFDVYLTIAAIHNIKIPLGFRIPVGFR